MEDIDSWSPTITIITGSLGILIRLVTLVNRLENNETGGNSPNSWGALKIALTTCPIVALAAYLVMLPTEDSQLVYEIISGSSDRGLLLAFVPALLMGLFLSAYWRRPGLFFGIPFVCFILCLSLRTNRSIESMSLSEMKSMISTIWLYHSIVAIICAPRWWDSQETRDD